MSEAKKITNNSQNKASDKINAINVEKILAEMQILKKIISVIPGNVYWKSRNGDCLGCNNNMAKSLGYSSPDDVIGKTNQQLFDPITAAKLDLIDQEIYSTGIGKTLEEHGPNRGKPAVFISKKTPLFDDNDQVIGLLGVSFDITERKQMEEALKIAKEKAEEANRSKTEFITNLSHDVKTPLAGIIGIAELLTYNLQAQELDFAKILLASSRQLLAFFDNCLEVFKLEHSNAGLVYEKFDLRETIKGICEIFLPSIQNRNLQLYVDYPDSVSQIIVGSRTGIYRIILNLISNAVKFTPRGSVTLKIREIEEQLQITVEDTGIGIPADKQQAIFDQFTRLIPSYKGTYDGSGIGLYIVHKFVASMNGRIEVTSEPEHGSQFIVTVPLTIQSNQLPSEIKSVHYNHKPAITENYIHSSNQALVIDQNTLNILLVEDNHIVQRIQTSLLNSLGCQVSVAETGEQALDLFQPGKYDLVLMDIGLPDMQGTLIAKLFRKLELGSNFSVPIIALTAHISDDPVSFTEYGINDIMQKPLSREQAEQILNQYVTKQKMIQKSFQHLESVKKMLII